jgi:SAM-dependent methyltransferase
LSPSSSGERRLAFGGVAELYDEARPSYPAKLVDDVIEFAGVAPGDPALEVGAGTGKATTLFADRGLELLALEPSADMADVARRNCATYRNVTIERAEFERWSAGGRSFRLLVSAQAWHWIAPEVRYVRAGEALHPGGALAVFWNRPDWESCALRDELAEAYERAAPDLGAGAGPGPMHPVAHARREWWGDWSAEIDAAAEFGPPDSRVYRWTEAYTTASYLRVIQTHSDHILLGEVRLQQLLDAVAAVLEAHGGGLRLDYLALLWMARATGESS